MTAVQTGTRAMLAQEYRDVADLLRTLTPQEWETETLCAGWRVRDVVAHVLYEATPGAGAGVVVVREGGGGWVCGGGRFVFLCSGSASPPRAFSFTLLSRPGAGVAS